MLLKMVYKIWLEENDKAFGQGPYELLKKVQQLGSLNKTVKEMNMSYSKGWSIINMCEEQLGFQLLERKTGGLEGGGSLLTSKAQIMMKTYRLFSDEAEEVLNSLYNKYFDPILK